MLGVKLGSVLGSVISSKTTLCQGCFQTFGGQCSSNVFFSCDGKVEFSASLPCVHPARASKWPEVIYFQCEPAASSGVVLLGW